MKSRPWWQPLVGAGSLGMGALQGLGGCVMILLLLTGPQDARTDVLVITGLCWLVPGLILAVSGMGVLLDRSWKRGASLAAVVVMVLALIVVASVRARIPVAVADLGEWGLAHTEAPAWVKEVYDDSVRKYGLDPIEELRDESRVEINGWTFTLYCGVPVLPWYLVLLVLFARPPRVLESGA